MSYALYGESLAYVHLVAHEDQDTLIDMFFKDVDSMNVKRNEVYNVYAVFGNQECRALEQRVLKMIEES